MSNNIFFLFADFLESNSKRIIPEFEIGLAIVYCTLEKYCNPNYQYTETMQLMNSEMKCPNESMNEHNDTLNTNNSEALDLEIPETDENIAHSTPHVGGTEQMNSVNTMVQSQSEDVMDTMPSADKTTAPTVPQPLKRKHITTLGDDKDDEDDDDLFAFSKKKCTNKPMEIAEAGNDISKRENNVNQVDSKEKELPRKRTYIQVLDDNSDNNDEDDLFNFECDERPAKMARQSNGDYNGDDNEDNKDLAEDFQGISISSKTAAICQTTKSSLYKTFSTESKLPQKYDAQGWLSKKEIKTEKLEENEIVIKKEESEPDGEESLSEEYKKWLDTMKDAVQILKISLNHSHRNGEGEHGRYKYKPGKELNGTECGVVNFKTFKKVRL